MCGGRRAFLIVGENTSYEQITPAHARFLTGTGKTQGAWLTNTHSFVKSSSLGQYIALLSGQYTACEANNDLPDHCHQRVPNLFSELSATGRGWRDYQRSMPNACNPVDGGAAWARNIYSAHHDPALYFAQIQGARVDEAITPSAPCRKFDLPMGTTAPDGAGSAVWRRTSGVLERAELPVGRFPERRRRASSAASHDAMQRTSGQGADVWRPPRAGRSRPDHARGPWPWAVRNC